MKKAMVLLLTAAMLTACLTGCGNGKKEPAETTPTSGSTTASSGTTATESQKEPEKTTEPTETGGIDLAQKEAPMLAEQVASGKLPPLEERIPVAGDAMVEPDIIELGAYGGSMTIYSNDNGRWRWGPYTEQGMFRFKQDGSGVVEANVCKDFYPNEDASVWTIELREGMKWSDGEPFTADDVLFYYDHMSTPALAEDRTAVPVDAEGYYSAYTSKPYNCYQAIGEDGKKYWAEFEKIDDYKFTVTFVAPKPSFPEDVTVDNKWMFLPKHFYKDFVSRKDGVTDDPTFPYITEEEALANANKAFGKQWDAYSSMGKSIGYYHWDFAIVPQLRSFIAVKDNWNTVGQVYELVRNPYFFKTDSEGRQLPYLDSIKVQIINEKEQVVLKTLSGEIDVMSPDDRADNPTIATGTQSSHQIVGWYTADWSGTSNLMLNQTVKDLDKRALYQDARFRQALSISVDRNLINQTLLNGMSSPGQSSVPEGAVGHDEEWTTKWTEYDVEKANALLDEITEPWDRTDGTYRKMKGTDKDVEIILSIKEVAKEGDILSLCKTAWRKIGVKLSEVVDADVATSILNNNVEAEFGGIALSTPAIRPDDIVPMRNYKTWYSAYGKWYEDGKSTANGGVEPTGDILELITAYENIKTAAGADREAIVAENVQKIYDLHKENIWIIGFTRPLPMTWFVNNNIKNFPEGILYTDEFRFASMMRPEQIYRSDVQ